MNITERFLKAGRHTRSKNIMPSVSGIVHHWIGNAGTTAEQNARYFDSIADSGPRYASYHYIVDIDGSVLQLMPNYEVAWHAGPAGKTKPDIATALPVLPNYCTIGVAHCHKDWDGAPSGKAYQTLLALDTLLCGIYGIDPETRVYRHYDITGKVCPRYWVNHSDEWSKFIRRLTKAVRHGTVS